MQKGFLSFVLGAIFLFAIVSSAAHLSNLQPDRSYEKYRSFFVSEIAIKQAFYSSISDAAKDGLATASASETDPRAAIRAAVAAQAGIFLAELSLQGYAVEFWCGNVPEAERQRASGEMARQKKAILPMGALPLAECENPFDANLLERKIRMNNLGFSIYLRESGIGKAAILPQSFEVEF